MSFVLAAKIADVPVGSVHEIQVAGKAVALANVDGKFFAINNTCLHRGGPLGEGSLQDKIVTCPWHGWEYDLSTGQSFLGPGSHLGAARMYSVAIEHGAEIGPDAVPASPPPNADGRIPGPYVAETVSVFVEEDYVVIED